MEHACGVCGGIADCLHFGALSCRACAAFFRRRVAIGEKIIPSLKTCIGKCIETVNYPKRVCARCRFEKCIQIGMKPWTVLSRPPVKDVVKKQEKDSLLKEIMKAYQNLEEARRTVLKKGLLPPKMTNYKELNAVCAVDFQLIIQHYVSFFHSITNVEIDQKRVLDAHFLVPFALLDGAFRSAGNQLYIIPNGDLIDLEKMNSFYQDPEEQNNENGETAAKLLKPYWQLNSQGMWKHLKEVQLDTSEYLLLSALVYWDFGITNQNDECIQECKHMRWKVLEELTTYVKRTSTKDHSMRVGEIIMILQTVQKTLGIMYHCRDIGMVYNLYGRECPLFKAPDVAGYH